MTGLSNSLGHLWLPDAGVTNWPTISGEITKLDSTTLLHHTSSTKSSPFNHHRTVQLVAMHDAEHNTVQSWMGWIRATFGSFSPSCVLAVFPRRKHSLFLLCPSQPGENLLDRLHQNVSDFLSGFSSRDSLVKKSMLRDIWVDKSLLLVKVVNTASSYECKYYRINGISLPGI